jgi:hypothetical protein
MNHGVLVRGAQVSCFRRYFGVAAAVAVCLVASFPWLARSQTPVESAAAEASVPSLEYYLGGSLLYASGVPTPEEYFGFQVGQRHLEHHQLVGYLRRLAEVSDRVSLVEYGRSHGHRPLVLLAITAPENHQRLEEIRQQHALLATPGLSGADQVDLDQLPVVVNLGYGVHGDEPSASNAAPLVAYHLAAGRGRGLRQLLQQSVILIDPCLNPDGFDRFAHWANNHRGQHPVADSIHREHQQPWPSGRSNYYWFDLNRDWLPLQHPESQGRIEQFYRWRPNVVLDFHEMGTNSTYFFQPGVPTRNHPLIPKSAYRLTEAIGRYHANALDEIGSLYYTRESFDDFYPGKGSTYPDLHGSVGILFEQASSRGHVQESIRGPITFPFTIRNQVRTSLSSLEAAHELRKDLLVHMQQFYLESLEMGHAAPVQAYLLSAPGDPARIYALAEILRQHRIEGYQPSDTISVGGRRFAPEETLLLPAEQPEYRFLRALFDRQTDFEENIFYDTTAWSLQDAFNLDFIELPMPLPKQWLGLPLTELDFPSQSLWLGGSGESFGMGWPMLMAAASDREGADEPATAAAKKPPLAYHVVSQGYYAPRALYRLLAAGVKVQVATKPFSLGEGSSGNPGDWMIVSSLQDLPTANLERLLSEAAVKDALPIKPIDSGLASSGIDLGSPGFRLIKTPKIALAVGSGVSTSEAGEVWHLLDHRFEIPVVLVEQSRLGGLDWSSFTHLVLPSGSYGDVGEATVQRLQTWVREGGTVVAIGSAIRWVGQAKLASPRFRAAAEVSDSSTEPTGSRRPFGEAQTDRDLERISGAIFATDLDITHPLAYGYVRSELPVFRSSTLFLEPSRNPYSSPAVFPGPDRAAGQLAGYLSQRNVQRLAGTASAIVQGSGSGRVVMLADNPNFRAYWYGTNRLFLNALLLGELLYEPSGG